VNIYVETNFVLELTFEQEQNKACEKILELSQTNQILILTVLKALKILPN